MQAPLNAPRRDAKVGAGEQREAGLVVDVDVPQTADVHLLSAGADMRARSSPHRIARRAEREADLWPQHVDKGSSADRDDCLSASFATIE